MATTQAQLDTLCYEILRENENTSAYPETLMHSLQNYAQVAICGGNIEDPLTKKQVVKGPLPFLYSDQFYSTVMDTYLSADATVGASTLDLSSTTNFATSGQVWVNGNIITYTGKSSTQLTGCSNIDFAFQSGTRVSQLFSLPTDFAASVRVIYNGLYQVYPQDYRTMYTQKNNYKDLSARGFQTQNNTEPFPRDIPAFYSIIQGLYLLPVNIDASGYSLHLMYEKAPPTITSVVDTTIPDKFVVHTVPQIAVAEILYERGEEERATRLLNRAIGRVKMMYDYYSQENAEQPFGNRVRTSKDQILNL